MRMRLKDNHPLTEKFYALMEKAEELGIYLEVVGETMCVSDGTTTAAIRDVESTYQDHTVFPPATDFKLVVST